MAAALCNPVVLACSSFSGAANMVEDDSYIPSRVAVADHDRLG
jgi:hypothetical protein